MAGALFGAAALGVLGYLPLRKDGADPDFRRSREAAAERAGRARELARKGVPPEGGLAVFRNDPLFEARQLWDEHCASCHSFSAAELEGSGDQSPRDSADSRANPDKEGTPTARHGPNLSGYNSRRWIESFLRHPDAPRLMGRAGLEDGMKPVVGSDDELRALTELIYAETGARDVDRSLLNRAVALFSDKDCDSCHDRDGSSENTGPNLKGRGTLAYLVDIISSPGDPRLYGSKNRMPAFSEKLSPDQIADLARFVLLESTK